MPPACLVLYLLLQWENTKGICKAYFLLPGLTIQLLKQLFIKHLLCARSLMAKYKQGSILLLISVFPNSPQALF